MAIKFLDETDIASSTKLGAVKIGDGINIAEDGTISASVSGGEKEFKQVVKFQSDADSTYITITEDIEGNALSFDEAYIAIISARASDATTNGNFCFALVGWSTPFNGKGLYNNTLFADAYLTFFHVLNTPNVGVMVERLHQLRTAASLSSSTWYSSLGTLSSSPSSGAIYLCNCKNASKDDGGKLNKITMGVDLSTSTKIGAGTRIEVWVR